MHSGVHASLYSYCYHQIIFAKFDLEVFYPSPYERSKVAKKHSDPATSTKCYRSLLKALLNEKKYHDMISIRMLKLCDDSICKALDLIFRTCLRNGRFQLEWKKASVVPIRKKGDKQTIKNYCPVSHLPIYGKNI